MQSNSGNINGEICGVAEANNRFDKDSKLCTVNQRYDTTDPNPNQTCISDTDLINLSNNIVLNEAETIAIDENHHGSENALDNPESMMIDNINLENYLNINTSETNRNKKQNFNEYLNPKNNLMHQLKVIVLMLMGLPKISIIEHIKRYLKLIQLF